MEILKTLKQKHNDLKTKLYKTKTKKAISKLQDAMSTVEHSIEDIYRDLARPWENKRVTGVVLYSGTEVMVKTELGTILVNACSDIQSKSWYNETCCVSFEKGSTIEFTLKINDITYRGVDIGGADISGGVFDAEQYEKLCKNKNLAFFKYPNSDGVTGLFL